MNLNKPLKKAGLDQKERKTYLALLSLGEGSVKEIAFEAKLKRPHVYNILEDLQDRNLVSKAPDSKKTIYYASDPKFLLKEITETRNSVKEIIPDLQSLYGKHGNKPRVRLLEGVKGIGRAYDEALLYDHVDMCGSLDNVKEVFEAILEKVTNKAKKNKKAHIRDLLTQDQEGFAYHKNIKEENHEVRFLPKDLEFPIDCFIFGNSVALFSLRGPVFALIIENKDITRSMKTFFELAWRGSKTIDSLETSSF